MLFQVRDVDRSFYEQHLADLLPAKLIDVHTHIWRKEFVGEASAASRGPTWPSLVAAENPIEDLFETYQLMFPQHQVTPLVFTSPGRDVDLKAANDYVEQVARQHSLPSLLVSIPEWSADQLEEQVTGGGFLGLKPYLSFAPVHIPAQDITILDFLPPHQLEVADEHHWIVMLHIPRPARLQDPVNLQQMIDIERRYPNIHLIVAHVGRAYCAEDVGNAFQVLQETGTMCFDLSANTNAWVMEQAIRAVGPKCVLFGSDLPILRMRMRRICENGRYINLVPPGLYGDICGDPHMREVSPEDGEQLSFFMYEELLAFRQAAEATALDEGDLQDIFCHNAARLIAAARRDAGEAGRV